MEKEIISYSQARNQGLKRYFTGKPCKHGHTAERRALDGVCLQCVLGHANPPRGYGNRGEDPEKSKEHYAAALEKYDMRRRNRRALKRSKRPQEYARQVRQLAADQGNQCANPLCREMLAPDCHVDHIMPLKLGGEDDISNLQILCADCSLRKGAKHPDKWRQEIGWVA